MFFPCLETGIQGSWIPGNAVSFSIYLVLFLLCSAVQLLAAGWEKDRLRKISKPFCVFVLFFAALMTFPTRWALYLGLLCGMIGDIFLIFTDNKTCVGLGILFFLCEHIFLITEACFSFGNEIGLPLGIGLDVIAAALYVGVILTVRKVYALKGTMLYGGSLYAVALAMDLVFQIVGVALGHLSFIYGIVGGLFFLVSDGILTFTMFKKNFRRSDLPIMATYLVAQLLYTIAFFAFSLDW